MDNKPYIGFINSHAKGIGRHHDLASVEDKVILVLPPLPVA